MALYALPDLRQPLFQEELRREAELIKLANAKGLFDTSVEFKGNFDNHWRGLARAFKSASVFCLIVSAVCTFTLLYSTGKSSKTQANSLFAWGIIVFGLSPSIWILYLNLSSLRRREEAADIRHRLSQEIIK